MAGDESERARSERTWAARELRSARSAVRVTVDCHAGADALLRLGLAREEQLVVLPPGLELTAQLQLARRAAGTAPGPLRRGLGVAADAVLVGVSVGPAPLEAPALALAVFELLALRHPQLEFVFLDDAAERVTVAGEPARRLHTAPERDGERVLGAAAGELDALLFTARGAGLPEVLIEAAAAGLPIVATPVGGVEELVVHERTGFVGADAAELAVGLDQLLRAPDAARAMGQRARLRVADRHGAQQLTERLEALYSAAIQEAACAS
jgi:glycosyltransferase involved in cell wall biosynthesis